MTNHQIKSNLTAIAGAQRSLLPKARKGAVRKAKIKKVPKSGTAARKSADDFFFQAAAASGFADQMKTSRGHNQWTPKKSSSIRGPQ